MAKKEANFDLYIHDLLVEAGIQADTQGSNIVPINEALKTASKHQTGKAGFPEYTAVVGDFVLVMEDKADRANLCLKEADGTISMTVQATTDYAVNGALHYAQHILQKTTYKKVFAFGNAGDSKHHTLQPLFVDKNGYKWLPEVQTFENFSAAHIVEYYKQIVLEETPPEDIELADILKKAKELHEFLRNYGGLGEDEKPLVVSAILLALREKEYGFNLNQLTGDTLESNTDGAILGRYIDLCADGVITKQELMERRKGLDAQIAELQSQYESIEQEDECSGSIDMKLISQKLDEWQKAAKTDVSRELINSCVAQITPVSNEEFRWVLDFQLSEVKGINMTSCTMDGFMELARFVIPFEDAKAFKASRNQKIHRRDWTDLTVIVGIRSKIHP